MLLGGGVVLPQATMQSAVCWLVIIGAACQQLSLQVHSVSSKHAVYAAQQLCF